jgi:hypothetical protein
MIMIADPVFSPDAVALHFFTVAQAYRTAIIAIGQRIFTP